MLNIVIPMAGMGHRFSEVGFDKPKPFIEVDGKAMIVRVLENLYVPNARYILIAQSKHIEQEKTVVAEIKKKFNVTFLEIDGLTEGTASTILYARRYINNERPLLIANSDQLVDIDISKFIDNCVDRSFDGSILTFIDEEMNPKWSYAKVNSNNLVIEVKEKVAISNLATVGLYYYRQGKEYVNAAIDMIVANDRVSNEFYTCPTYNYAIKNGLKIGTYTIDSIHMHGLGTPEDLNAYLKLLKV